MEPMPKAHQPLLELMVKGVLNNSEPVVKVCLRDQPTFSTKWPLAKIIKVHRGKDGNVRVVTVRTTKG